MQAEYNASTIDILPNIQQPPQTEANPHSSVEDTLTAHKSRPPLRCVMQLITTCLKKGSGPQPELKLEPPPMFTVIR